MNKTWSLFLALLFSTQAGQAAPLAWDPWQGRLGILGFSYLERLRSFHNFATQAELETTLGLKNESFGFRLTPWVKAQFPDDRAASGGGAVAFLEAKEGWAELVQDNWDLRVGNQLLAWGTTDGINPTDIWNAWDMTDPFNPVKLPSLAAKLSIHPLSTPNFVLDFVGVPRARVNRLPVDLSQNGPRAFQISESRWLVNIPSQIKLSASDTVPLAYELEPSAYPERWEGGARLRFLRIKGWDFSLSGGETVAKTPQVNFRTQGSLVDPNFAVTAFLSPTFYRLRSYGADAAGSWGDVGIRAEASLRNPVGAGIAGVPSSTFLGVLGADYTVPRKILGAALYLNFSYAHKDERGGDRISFTAGIPDLEPWDRTLLLLGELQWEKKYTAGLRTMASLKNSGNWLHPYARANFWENTSLELSGDLFSGNPLGALGQFAMNKRASLLLQQLW